MVKMLQTVLVLVCLVSSLMGDTRGVLALHELMPVSQAREMVLYSGVANVLDLKGRQFLVMNKGILFFDYDSNIKIDFVEVKADKWNDHFPLSVVIHQNQFVGAFHNSLNGQRELMRVSFDGDVLQRSSVHSLSKPYLIRKSRRGDEMIMIGLYDHQYTWALETYDDEETGPTDEQREAFDAYFASATGSMVNRFQLDLSYQQSFDSLALADKGVQVRAWDGFRWGGDVDEEGNIHLFLNEENMQVKTLDASGKVIREKLLESEHYKPNLPLPQDKRSELEFSANAGLLAVEDHLLVSFCDRKGFQYKMNPPFHYIILDRELSEVARGSTPHPIYCRDNGGGLHFYVEKEAEGWLSKETCYLVRVSLRELVKGGLDEKYFDQRIKGK